MFQCLSILLASAFGKDSERRAQRQTENEVFGFDYAEPHPILWKDSERRAQRQTENEVFGFDYAEPHPIFALAKI